MLKILIIEDLLRNCKLGLRKIGWLDIVYLWNGLVSGIEFAKKYNWMIKLEKIM